MSARARFESLTPDVGSSTSEARRGLLGDLLRTSAAQGASVLLNAASLAVISRRLGQVDLGLYTLERRSMAFLQPVVLLGLSVATPRFIALSLGAREESGPTYASAGVAVVGAAATILAAVMFLFPAPFAATVFGDTQELALTRALAGFVFATALFQIVYSVY